MLYTNKGIFDTIKQLCLYEAFCEKRGEPDKESAWVAYAENTVEAYKNPKRAFMMSNLDATTIMTGQHSR